MVPFVVVLVFLTSCYIMSLLFADIDTLITISGMVIRNSTLIPEMREGMCFAPVHQCWLWAVYVTVKQSPCLSERKLQQ